MRVLKWIGIVMAAIVVIGLGLYATAYVVSERQMTRVYAMREEPPLPISSDEAAVERGRYLATSVNTCVDCHAPDLGGRVFLDAGPLGVVVGPNLTRGRGGIGGTYTDRDWERAIRHGLRPDGTSVIIMPSEAFIYLTDADAAAIVSFLKQLSPVDRELPRTSLRWLGRILMASGRLPLLVAPRMPESAHVASVDTTPSVAYGRYLADIGGCSGCHGPGLSGGQVTAGPPGAPPAANLTPTGIGTWTEADFTRALRERVRPDGRQIDPFMPALFGSMADDELHALWLYVRSVPPKPFGNK